MSIFEIEPNFDKIDWHNVRMLERIQNRMQVYEHLCKKLADNNIPGSVSYRPGFGMVIGTTDKQAVLDCLGLVNDIVSIDGELLVVENI